MTITRDEVAIITGGATGIGLATAKELTERGVRVVLAGRDAGRGEAAAAGLGAVFRRCDVRREADVAGLVAFALERFGRLDLMFNNAGVEGTLNLITDIEEADIDDVLATNLKGVLFGMKHALRAMVARGRGVVVNNASFVGTTLALPVAPIYGPSKAAVISATRAAAAAVGTETIRIYAVCPYMIATPMLERLTGGDAAATAQFAGLNPSGQIAAPAEVARVVADMLFAAAPFEQGSAVFVDHGGRVGEAPRA